MFLVVFHGFMCMDLEELFLHVAPRPVACGPVPQAAAAAAAGWRPFGAGSVAYILTYTVLARPNAAAR